MSWFPMMLDRKRSCIVWGATGQAKVVYDILISEGVRLVQLFDNNTSTRSPFDDVPISYGVNGLISFVDHIKAGGLNPCDIDCIAAIGGSNGEQRETMTRLMQGYGFTPRSLMHNSAIISPLAYIGANVQILAGSIIGAFASIGDYSIINSGANVDHDCTIGKNCHLAPRATLAGEVIVENNVFIGTNATVLPRRRICSGAVIGAGAVVTKDVPAGSVVAGNPACPLVR